MTVQSGAKFKLHAGGKRGRISVADDNGFVEFPCAGGSTERSNSTLSFALRPIKFFGMRNRPKKREFFRSRSSGNVGTFGHSVDNSREENLCADVFFSSRLAAQEKATGLAEFLSSCDITCEVPSLERC